MASSDPAVAAAERVRCEGAYLIAESAAREALAPVRELHSKADCDDAECGEECRYGFPMCAGCLEPWPCDTARLVYTTEELNRDGE